MNGWSFRRTFSFLFAALFLAPLVASAAPTPLDFRVLLDTDNRADTGCTVVTAGGLVKGVEQVLTTSVLYDATAGTAAVTSVTRQTCSDPVANTFSAPIIINATGWPAGVSPSGDLTIETHLPASAVPLVGSMRVAFTATSPTLADSVLFDNGDVILWPPAQEAHRRAVGIGTTRQITLDGAMGDWDGLMPLAAGTGEGSPALRFSSVWVYTNANDIFFAFVVQANPKAPTANPDTYSVEAGKTLAVNGPGVLSNDTDPSNKPLTAILIAGPQHGSLTLNANGSFTYINDGSNAPQDSFVYKANNGTLDSNAAQVTIDVTPSNPNPPPTPHFTSANSTRFTAGTAGNFNITAQPLDPPVTITHTSGPLPAGVSFAGLGNGAAHIFGTPAPNTGGVYPMVFKATNAVGSATQNFTLTVCNVISVTNPATTTATANAAFSASFTQTGAVGTPTFSIASGTLPAGLTLAPNGTLSGTPTQTGTFTVSVKVTDVNGCSGTGGNYSLTVNCQTITVNNPATATGTAGAAFSQTFTATNAIGATTFALASGTLPTGLTLNANGTLSGTPVVTGSFPITVKATDANGCNGTGPTYTLVINCQTITVNNPAGNSGTAGSPFSATFTQSGAIAGATFTLASGSLPTGLSLSAGGVLSGTPMQTGTFPITVKATDGNGCTGTGPTYNLVINCQPITVNNPATSMGTAYNAFSQTFTQTGGIGATTFSTASTLPSGLTLSSGGVLSGTPGQTGTFPIVVTATDSNGCTGTGTTYNLVISCPVVTVTNPANSTATVGSPFSVTFTESGSPSALFSIASGTLPAGLSLSSTGVLSGTPTQFGTFPITVSATDNNSCGGTGPTYTLVVNCQPMSVTNPSTNTGVAGTAFSQTFSQTGAIGGAVFSTTSTLPNGLTLSSGGVLSGTPTQTGTFPIVVTATDANGCSANGPTYSLTINCQVITVTNPAGNTGTAGSPFSATFTQSGAIGGATFSTASTLPAGLTLSSGGLLAGTPMVVGTFPIVVTVTDGNGCTGSGTTYNLTIGCQTITVTNPANATGTAAAAFSEQFSQSGAIGSATFSTASTLPTGLTLSSTGLLSGTPTQTGTFPIVVTVTDGNGCTGSGTTYNLVINCQTITVTNPANTAGTVSSPFSEQFSQSGAIGTPVFSTASTLPAGLTLSSSGLLSGTPTQTGTFPIVVTVTDDNGCTGSGATYSLVINCQTISVTNPANSTGTANAAFSEQFNQSGAVGGATFSTASTLPAGLTLSGSGLLSGTPTQTGTFPIVVTVTDGNGCTGTGTTYNLTINCQSISVINPGVNTGTAGTAFSQSFSQSGAIGGATFSTASTLPAGLTLSGAGVLSGTPTQTGSFPIVVTVTDGNGCTGTGSTYTLTIGCQTITVTNPGVNTGTAGTAFSQTFTQSGAIGGASFSTSSTLPTGLSLNSSTGVLSGTPTVVGTFPITVTVTDGNGCTGTGPTYNLTIGCQTITVTNPATNTGTAASAFSQTFTQSGAIGGATFSTASTLPAGLTLSGAGLLSGTPTQTGTFPIVVTVTDGNGCTGTGSTYNLTINCQTITVTNPANTTGTVSSPFSEQFSQSGAIGSATFSTASTLPSGLTLSSSGLLSGTPLVPGSFPIVVTVTDSNGCTGTGTTYNLTINCQTITVTNPTSNSDPAGTPLVAANFTFTQSGAIGGATFSTASTLPTGVTLSSAGVLSGTPTQGGSFPITVTVTDGNGCTGTSSGYVLTITCPVITVTNPGVSTGTAGTAFSQTFTQSGGQGTITWSQTGALPSGFTLNSSTGVLSGTTTQVGTFPITVTATDANGCTGSGAQYNLTINCQTVTVTNPGVNTGTVDAAFSQTFTATGILGTATWSETGALPAGITLNSSTGVLSGTPTVNGVFPITVKATDSNGCFGTSNYTLTINCQTITVTNPVVTSGTVDAAFSQTFSQTGGHGTTTFSLASGSLPAGLTLSSAGVLSGTPTVPGSFPIVVRATDANGCFGDGPVYALTINCQTITVTNPATTTGTVNAAFTATFTQSGAHGTATFSTASTLPSGITLSSAGVLSGTPTQPGNFPVTVTVTDSNGCTGSSSGYTLIINCQTITVTNPANNNGTVASPFSEQFTQSGGIGTITWSETGTLPTGITLNSSTGILSGTPTQSGSFPITVKATDSNGCFGTSNYTLIIACNVITVTNPGVNTGTAGVAFSQTFTQSGGNGTITWSKTGALPTGITLNSSTGVLSGTTTQTGSFPITVTATDANGCQGSNNYTLTIVCQTITVTNPGVTQGTAGTAFSQTFTVSGILGTVTWSETGTLPTGITLNSSTGVLSGTTTQVGSFPIVVKATDTNGCFGTSNYTLTIICQTITVTNPATTSGTVGIAFSQTFTASGILGTPNWTLASGTLPTGLSLNASTGVLSGTPTQTGSFPITVTVTDSNTCSATGATYNLSIICPTITVARTGGGSFPQGTFNVSYTGQSVTASAVPNNTPTFTFTVTSGALPTGLSLNSSTGAISGTPTATGTFGFTVTATDQYSCSGSQAFSIAIKPNLGADSYSNLVNLTQEVITGGTTASPTTPFTFHSTKITANDTPAVTLTTGTFATTGGGSITIAADGTFIYTPPVGNLTSDTFTYTASSDTGATGTPVSATATITLNFANRVWYVQPGAALTGDGRSHLPFNNTSLIPSLTANDIVYVYNHSAPNSAKSKINLNAANTQLIGQGVALVVNSFTLVSAGTAPTLTNSTGAAPQDVVNVTANGCTIKGVTLSNPANALIKAASATGLTVQTSTLTPSGTANGFTTTASAGTFTISNVTMTGTSSGDMVNVSTGTAQWNFTSSPMTQTAGRALNVINKTGGGMSFDAASTITVSAGTTDGAITLTGNSGGETFAFSKIALTTSGTARPFVVSSTGTVSNTDNTSTIASATGNALDATSTALGLTLKSISANGAANGINLSSTTGSLSIIGDGTGKANGTGGTIANVTNQAVNATGAAGTYSFKSMGFTLAAAANGGMFFDNSAFSGTPNVSCTGCTFTGINSASQGHALAHFQLDQASGGVVNFQNSYFNLSHTYGFFATVGATGSANVTLNQCGFGTDVNTTTTGTNNPGTTMQNVDAIYMALTNGASGQMNYTVTNNTFWGASGPSAIYGVTISGGNTNAGSVLSGSFSGNKLGKTGTTGSGCANACGGVGLLPGTNGTYNVTFSNNDVRQTNSLAVNFQNTVSGSAISGIGHFTNNIIAEPDTTGSPAFQRALVVSTGNSTSPSTGNWCAQITGNTISGGWQTGNWIRITTLNANGILTLPGLSPTTGATTAQINAYIQGLNTFTGGTGSDVNTTIGGAINGGSPCP